MSHLISTEKQQNQQFRQAKPLVHMTKSKVALGFKAKKYLNNLGKSMEGMMVSDIFKQYSQKQQKIIDSNIDNQAGKAFQGLKKRLSIYGKGRRSTVFFKQNTTPKTIIPTIKSVQIDDNIYLQRKYVNNIAIRLQSLQQATKIQNQKRKLEYWRNKQFNSRTKSPNFSRMVYLLQNLNSKNMNLNEIQKEIQGQDYDLPVLLKAKKFQL